jgi:hypothetical protein
VQLGRPLAITAATSSGNLTSAAFSWFRINLAGNDWGLLAPNTYYWVGLLPGARAFPNNRDFFTGVVFGGAIDPTGDLLPQVRHASVHGCSVYALC